MSTTTLPDKLTTELAIDLAYEFEAFNYNTEVEVRDYSGRGMYGESVVAFVTDDPTGLATFAAAYLTKEFPDEDLDKILRLVPSRTDSMALSTVLY